MLSSNNISHKDKFAKWLLTATLLLSIFSVSGYVGQTQLRQTDSKQTELFVAVFSKTHKPSISYKKALLLFFNRSNFISFDRKNNLQFNRLIKTKINCLSKQDFIVFSSGTYFQNKIIPQSQDEEDFNS